MKRVMTFLVSLIVQTAYAQSTAEDTYVSISFAVLSTVGILMLVGVYKLGKFFILKILPTASISIQRASGVVFILVIYALMQLSM